MASFNNSSILVQMLVKEQQAYQIIRFTIFSTTLFLSVIGNGSLILILMWFGSTKKLSDKLIFNLSICNLLLSLISIPTELIIDSSADFPFGYHGCKIISPLATYASNSGVLTLLFISFERWHILCKPLTLELLNRKGRFIIVIIHILGFVPVIPYIITLEYTSYKHTRSCLEQWDLNSRRIYTASLFIIQYALPLILMGYFYVSAWIALAISNERTITNLERSLSSNLTNNKNNNTSSKNVLNKKQIDPFCASNPCDKTKSGFRKSKHNTMKTLKINNKNSSKLTKKQASYILTDMDRPRSNSVLVHLKKSTNISSSSTTGTNLLQNKAIVKRYQQSYLILRMFTVIVFVFAITMLPHQILWLLIDFKGHGDEHFNAILHDVAYVLTYASCVVNPLIYGGYNKSLRKDFQLIFRNALLVICCKNDSVNI